MVGATVFFCICTCSTEYAFDMLIGSCTYIDSTCMYPVFICIYVCIYNVFKVCVNIMLIIIV